MPGWKRSVIYCVSFIIAYLCNVAFDLACGPETDPYDYYTTFFRGGIVLPDHDYRPFYFNSERLLNDPDEQTSEADINTAEWAEYLKTEGATPKDISKVLYHLNTKTDSVYFRDSQPLKHGLPDSLKNNTFLNALQSKAQAQNALVYLGLIKKLEPLVNIAYQPWDPKPLDTAAVFNAGKAYLLKGANEKQDKFLKLRYLYQAQRLLHYAGRYKEAAGVYNDHIAGIKTSSHVAGWSLALKAGELCRLGDTVQSAYLFSKVFSNYPERRVQAYRNYVANHAPPAQVLKLAKNNEEQAAIYAIQGFHNYDLDLSALKNVYRIAPKSPMVNVLLLREINKLEERYLNGKLTGVDYYSYWQSKSKAKDSLQTVYANHINQLNTFCKQLSAERKINEPVLARLASAYLAWMQGDSKAGFATLTALSAEKLNDRLDSQRQIINLLLTAQSALKFDNVNEARLLPSLQWLSKKVRQEELAQKGKPEWDWQSYNEPANYANMSRDFYSLILKPAYLKQKDTVMAAFAQLNSEWGNTPINIKDNELLSCDILPEIWQRQLRSYHIQNMLKMAANPARTPYLKFFMTPVSAKSLPVIYELLGTVYLREHNYAAAVTSLNHVPQPKQKKAVSNIWNDDDKPQYPSPFVSATNDYPKIYAKAERYAYDKLKFATEMAALQTQIKAKPKDYVAYYKLASGLYNTSTYGNSWEFISYRWSSYDYEKGNRDYYDRDFTQCTSAEKYFLKARSLTNNPDVKAQCTFMAAKCRQKQIAYPARDYDDYKQWEKREAAYHLKVRNNPYFIEMQRDYAKTNFIKLAIADCSYLRDFLKARK